MPSGPVAEPEHYMLYSSDSDDAAAEFELAPSYLMAPETGSGASAELARLQFEHELAMVQLKQRKELKKLRAEQRLRDAMMAKKFLQQQRIMFKGTTAAKKVVKRLRHA